MNNETPKVDVCDARRTLDALSLAHRIERVKAPRHSEYFNVHEVATALVDMQGAYQGEFIAKGSTSETLVASFRKKAEAIDYIVGCARITKTKEPN